MYRSLLVFTVVLNSSVAMEFDALIRQATQVASAPGSSESVWEAALIEYFAQMAPSVDFQQAAAALDGCVRLYGSRVDAAAKETQRLLVVIGGARQQDAETVDDAEDAPNGPVSGAGTRKRTRKATTNTLTTLEKNRMKDSERPSYSDPIFKKFLTDFDEGGTKSLLNNLLYVDSQSRVVFTTVDKQSSDSWQYVEYSHIADILAADPRYGDVSHLLQKISSTSKRTENHHRAEQPETDKESVNKETDFELDLTSLRAQLGFNQNELDSMQVCPSLTALRDVSIGSATESIPAIIDNLNNMQMIQLPDVDVDYKIENDVNLTGNYTVENIPMFDNHYDEEDDDNDDKNTNNNANVSKPYSFFDDDDDGDQPNLTLTRLFDEESSHVDSHAASEVQPDYDADMVRKFDFIIIKSVNDPTSSKKEIYWKIRQLKKRLHDQKVIIPPVNEERASDVDSNGPGSDSDSDVQDDHYTTTSIKRKIKKDFIAFNTGPSDLSYTKLSPNDLTAQEVSMFIKPIHISKTISLNKSGEKYLLDEGFSIDKLRCLSLKPRKRFGAFLNNKQIDDLVQPEGAEYFANEYQNNDPSERILDGLNNNNNPYNDDDDEYEEPQFEAWDLDEPVESSPQAFALNGTPSSQFSLSRFSKPSIEFSKKSKKVDIKLLKVNIWKTIVEESNKKRAASEQLVPEESLKSASSDRESSADVSSSDLESNAIEHSDMQTHSEMKFSEVVKDAMLKYSGSNKQELSTSYCFISLLHLANEKGLILEGNTQTDDIIIKK